MNDILKKRYTELADRSFNTGTYTFTGFLGIADRSDLYSMERELSYAGVSLYGGYDGADRVVARFGRSEELGYEIEYPITCIHIVPLLKKFADELNHRDFLGAIMNLGIERDTIGDIKVNDREAYLLCLERIAPYIMENLTKIKHTNVKTSIISGFDKSKIVIFNEKPITKQITLSSLRVDGLISKVYNLSRNESLVLFQSQKVYVNGRLCENNSAKIISGDVINARGYGKFAVCADPKMTRKGKLAVNVNIW